jgi:hypothetical protein
MSSAQFQRWIQDQLLTEPSSNTVSFRLCLEQDRPTVRLAVQRLGGSTRLLQDDELASADWDILWTVHARTADRLRRQRLEHPCRIEPSAVRWFVNHHPQQAELSRKDRLALHWQRATLEPSGIPRTFRLPAQLPELTQFLEQESSQPPTDSDTDSDSETLFILKPADLARGLGIRLVDRSSLWMHLRSAYRIRQLSDSETGSQANGTLPSWASADRGEVLSEYLSDPLLYQGRKFDLVGEREAVVFRCRG